MKRIQQLALVTLCAFSLSFLSAQEKTVEQLEIEFEAVKTQKEKNAIAGKICALLDTALEKKEDKARSTLPDYMHESFENSCAKWKEYRKAQTNMMFTIFEGGIVAPAVHKVIYAEVTKSRIKELDGLLLLCTPTQAEPDGRGGVGQTCIKRVGKNFSCRNLLPH